MNQPDEHRITTRKSERRDRGTSGAAVGRWRVRWTVAQTIAIVLVVLAAVGVGAYLGGLTNQPQKYTIGILTDEVGLNDQDVTLTRTGFEHDMYVWMSGFTDPKFRYEERELTIAQRDFALSEGNNDPVDVVVGSYTITDPRLRNVKFAGPYLFTQQGVMVRRGGPLASITSPSQLVGKKVCAQTGSTSLEGLQALRVGVIPRPQSGLRECIDALETGQVEAVSTNQILMQSYVNNTPGTDLFVPPDVKFGAVEGWGIAVPKDDQSRCEEFTQRIKAFIQSGQWDQFYRSNIKQDVTPGSKPDPQNLYGCSLQPPPEYGSN